MKRRRTFNWGLSSLLTAPILIKPSIIPELENAYMPWSAGSLQRVNGTQLIGHPESTWGQCRIAANVASDSPTMRRSHSSHTGSLPWLSTGPTDEPDDPKDPIKSSILALGAVQIRNLDQRRVAGGSMNRQCKTNRRNHIWISSLVEWIHRPDYKQVPVTIDVIVSASR